jgi:hypothetical protein
MAPLWGLPQASGFAGGDSLTTIHGFGVVLYQHQIGTSALSDGQHCKTFFVEIRSLSALMGVDYAHKTQT